jgi:hypothetical protein
MGAHLIDGTFQSDKYPTTPRGKVPLSVNDPTAQDLLWKYAQRRRSVDAEFSDDLESALIAAGYHPPDHAKRGSPIDLAPAVLDPGVCRRLAEELRDDDPRPLMMRAIETAVDDALGEVARQQGGIAIQIGVEARRSGIEYGRSMLRYAIRLTMPEVTGQLEAAADHAQRCPTMRDPVLAEDAEPLIAHGAGPARPLRSPRGYCKADQ